MYNILPLLREEALTSATELLDITDRESTSFVSISNSVLIDVGKAKKGEICG